MLFRALKPCVVVLLTVLLAACSSGGGGGGTVGANCASGDPKAFCLTTCNLGCSLAGCTINAIAQNQPIFLQFNQDVDPNSVDSGSVSLRTPNGEEPQGRLIVNGPIVQFVRMITGER